MPGGLGFSQSSSESQSSSQGSTFVEEQQAPFLNFLRNMGLDMFGGFQGGAAQFGQQAQGLAGAAAGLGQNNPFLSFLQQQAGGNPELVQQQSDQLQQQLSQFFKEDLVQGINQGGVQANQFGGSRGMIGRGIAGRGVADTLGRGITQFQLQDQQRAQQAAQFGGQLFNQGQQIQQQGLGQAFNFLQGGLGAQFDPLLFLSQIFGQPNVLSQQSAQSTSSSDSFAVTGGI